MDNYNENTVLSEDNCPQDPYTLKTSNKPRKRSLVERELETNLTARVTSPITNSDVPLGSTSRYGRTRRMKTDKDFCNNEKQSPKTIQSPKAENHLSPLKVQSPVNRMHASNSPLRVDTPTFSIEKAETLLESPIKNRIESIYNENMSLSRFGKDNMAPKGAEGKVYVRKDLIQRQEKDETVTLLKNMFSPKKTNKTSSSTHLNNILERSSEKYSLSNTTQYNGHVDTLSVVKALDFDNGKKKAGIKESPKISNEDQFNLEARCEFQVGDLAWARVGTYPFWPCIVNRDPYCSTFVKKKALGRAEKLNIHVIFFGDNGRRGWIAENMLKKYLGLLEFETTRDQFTPEAKKKDPKLYAAYFITEKKLPKWNVSVEEAELLLREPKRLRIDILNDMLLKNRGERTTPNRERGMAGKLTRKDSDVSLSESLYDSLFSEDDSKADDLDHSKKKLRKPSLDVSDVVTACLDNMAAKTGMTKIQKQSHMDRWLQKAKSKTPEKVQSKALVSVSKLNSKNVNVANVKKLRSSKVSGTKLNIAKKSTKGHSKIVQNGDYNKVINNSTNGNIHEHIDANDVSMLDISHTKDDEKKNSIHENVLEEESGIGVNSNIKSLSEKDCDSFNDQSNQEIRPEVKNNNLTSVDKDVLDVSEKLPANASLTEDFVNEEINNCQRSENMFVSNINEEKDDTGTTTESLSKNILNNKAGNNGKSEQEVIVEEKDVSIDNNNLLVNKEISIENNRETENILYENNFKLHNDVQLNLNTLYNNIVPEINEDLKHSQLTINCIKENINFTNITKEKVLENNINYNNKSTLLSEDSNQRITVENIVAEENNLCLDIVNSSNKEAYLEQTSKKIETSLSADNIEFKKNKIEQDNNIDTEKMSAADNKNLNGSCNGIHKTHSIQNSSVLDGDSMENAVENESNLDNQNKIEGSLNIHNNGLKDHSNNKKNASFNDNTKKESIVNNELKNKTETIDNDIVTSFDNCRNQSDKGNVENKLNVNTNIINEALEQDPNVKNVSINEDNLNNVAQRFSKRLLRSEKHTNDFKMYESPDFLKYVEIKQDALIDENPDLSQEEVLSYMYKTWTYEQELKSEEIKNDELKQSNLVKGLGIVPMKKKKVKREQISNFLITVQETKKNNISKEVKQDILVNSNEDNLSKKVEEELVDSQIYDAPEKRDIDLGNESIKTADDVSESDSSASEEASDTIKEHFLAKINENSSSKNTCNESSLEKNTSTESSLDKNTIDKSNPQTIVQTNKPKLRIASIKKYDDPEFLKYLELRQDALMDENPDLSHTEVMEYLYKTWSYEENFKSDDMKNDNLNQWSMVKGLGDVAPVQRKKIKKKSKVEKEYTDSDESVIPKDKSTRRKIIKPYYNEDLSDSDFDDDIGSTKQDKSSHENEEGFEDQDINEAGDVEYFFSQLTAAKPNVFKGLNREKVCEICEQTNNLVKCKGPCAGMYHVNCIKKPVEPVIETSLSRGRKKKKLRGRKPKNIDEKSDNKINGTDSDSQGDDKSQDSIDDTNVSLEEIETPNIITNVEDFEAQLTVKMKEMLENAANVLDESQYTSDDELDWNNMVAGRCEIVDVKLKPKHENLENRYVDFKCSDCQKYTTPPCFVCKSIVSPKSMTEARQRCNIAHCHKYYHLECLEQWPQTQYNSGESSRSKTLDNSDIITCPRHVCHTCVCDDPRGCKTRFSGDKLAKCVRCPAVYHSFTKCLPAGSQVLTGSHIICPRHHEHNKPGKVPCHVNTGWCFICALGGSLICCEYCPTSFHAECLNIKPPEGGYMCEDCETGRLPLYGEMVWVKLGHYRWWPGVILHPVEIPENILAVKHSPGEFVVRFFGQYDHYWVNRGRVFPFQEGDTGKISSQKSKIDAAFTRAMEDAQIACELLKNAQPNVEESIDIASSLLPPHYVKLKVNKPCGSVVSWRPDASDANSLTQCECDPEDLDPCGPDSQCLNRMLLTECGPACRAGERCRNRAFERRRYPRLVPYRTPHRGWGLKTLDHIAKGQFVIEYVGELIDEEEFRRRMKRKHEVRDENFYFLTLDKDRMIDAGPKGNLARFMNHCCEPNCETQKWTVLGDVRVGLFAIYDIPANTEVTFNYNFECAGMEKKQCMCGARRCAGYIGAKLKQEESQPKKPKVPGKRAYKKRKSNAGSPTTNTSKNKIGRPRTKVKAKALTEIEKDLLIIKNATNGLSSDSECDRLTAIDKEAGGDVISKPLKRKRVSFSTEEVIIYDGGNQSPSVKRVKVEDAPASDAILDGGHVC